MTVVNGNHCTIRTSCTDCPLHALEGFRPFTPDQLSFISHFKVGEFTANAGATILVEGAHSAHLFTVLEGWGFRHKVLDDGRRQILNYVLPGSLVGLQGSLLGEMQHSVEALTPMTLCVFERDRIDELFRNHPALAYDVTWIAAREERILDEHLLSIGRRSALERSAYLLAALAERSRVTGQSKTKNGDPVHLPITQVHVADTLGLSVVHTNKTLRKLADRNLIRWLDRGCEVRNVTTLAEVAGWELPEEFGRPFL
ncbi:Nitrogen fixation regulation protein FixK [Hartmannibacter diazotrophicus]|uniref:Nitrogen fixation regulation protein FixK n=1 Tax=Hartmannibacter diazotrophicus TaxID=1482074 RepID=A0A2C9D793_9HYPH|nr:Crp/Fnr family transcriptional regulator [Hartmannibacter diazotrophicus]SON56167.1 Nitrogen fixation regulation protein FixK [Hartmannibacter diazotrophicus]